MDPLSRKLTDKYQKVGVQIETDMYITNHLLFIDDLKLLAESDEELQRMMNETKLFFDTIGLEMIKANPVPIAKLVNQMPHFWKAKRVTSTWE